MAATSPEFVTTLPIAKYNTLKDLGVWTNRGGTLVLNNYLPNFEIFKLLFVGVGGDVVVEGIDGVNTTYSAVPGGTYLEGLGYRVVTGTTATSITWRGGVGSLRKAN